MSSGVSIFIDALAKKGRLLLYYTQAVFLKKDIGKPLVSYMDLHG